MARLRQILNALVVAIGAIIAWNERRDPAPRGPAARTQRPATGSPVGATDAGQAAPTAEDAAAVGDRATAQPPAARPRAAETTDSPVGAEPAPEPTTATRRRAATQAAEPSSDGNAGRPGAARGQTAQRSAGAATADVPAGAVPGDGTTTCPPTHPIKGNASSMIYHEPGRASYARTEPEFCFATTEDAEAAGYRPPRR